MKYVCKHIFKKIKSLEIRPAMKYVCIHCGNEVSDLVKERDTTKQTPDTKDRARALQLCDDGDLVQDRITTKPSPDTKDRQKALQLCTNKQCNKKADEYLDSEPVIALLDALLLSEKGCRHLIFNSEFSLKWKIFLVLLIVKSFTKWHQVLIDLGRIKGDEPMQGNGFFFCCIVNMFEDFLVTLLLVSSVQLSLWIKCFKLKKNYSIKEYAFILGKAVAVANFSNVLLLPILVWGQNESDVGLLIHNSFLILHRLLLQTRVFWIVSGWKLLPALLLNSCIMALSYHYQSNIYKLYE